MTFVAGAPRWPGYRGCRGPSLVREWFSVMPGSQLHWPTARWLCPPCTCATYWSTAIQSHQPDECLCRQLRAGAAFTAVNSVPAGLP
jgi:hypothetical protein